MSGRTAEIGSFDQLVSLRVAEFRATGIDASTKVSLIELAWTQPDRGRTVLEFTDALGSIVRPDVIQGHLDELTAQALFVRSDEGALDAARYALTPSETARARLSHLMDLWSDPNFRTRTAAALRFGKVYD